MVDTYRVPVTSRLECHVDIGSTRMYFEHTVRERSWWHHIVWIPLRRNVQKWSNKESWILKESLLTAGEDGR